MGFDSVRMAREPNFKARLDMVPESRMLVFCAHAFQAYRWNRYRFSLHLATFSALIQAVRL